MRSANFDRSMVRLARNPTGSSISADKACRILQLARQHNLLIVENDALADFKPTLSPRLSSLDQLERTICVCRFSNSFCAALRVGFLACDANLASDLADVKALVHGSNSEYCERTVGVIMAHRQDSLQGIHRGHTCQICILRVGGNHISHHDMPDPCRIDPAVL